MRACNMSATTLFILAIVLIFVSFLIGTGLVWVLFWLLHMVIEAVPVLTIKQAAIVSIIIVILKTIFGLKKE